MRGKITYMTDEESELAGELGVSHELIAKRAVFAHLAGAIRIACPDCEIRLNTDEKGKLINSDNVLNFAVIRNGRVYKTYSLDSDSPYGILRDVVEHVMADL